MSKSLCPAMLVVLAIVGNSLRARADEQLAVLETLVGDWEAEARTPDGRMISQTISYRWLHDRKLLRAESERKVGDQSVQVTITYFYDAPARKIRAWVIASDGSWSQAEVEATQGAVRHDTRGVGAEGVPITLVSNLRPTGERTWSEEWTDIKVGGQPQPSPPATVWSRKNNPTTLAPTSISRDWASIRADRAAVVKRHLRAASKGYDWFANAMHGEPAGTPYILLRVLPELAPDLWGRTEERFARFGFFDDPDDSDRPLPLGLGWVVDPVNGDDHGREYHSATLTCAACHVGRIRVSPDRYELLIGAPNTEIDVRKFRRAVELTVDRFLGSEAEVGQTAVQVARLVKAKPADYQFFGGRYGLDAAAEAPERERFQDPEFVAPILNDLARRVRGGRAAVEKQLATSYSRPNAPPLDGGSPGQSDGSGDLIPKLLLGRELSRGGEGDPVRRFLAAYYPEMPFRNATVTDNPSVWRQVDRPFGQLDGSIRAPIIRNIAAQTAVVGSSRGINVRNADLAVRFTAALPPPPYPFDVDATRAARGEKTFRRHCQACHRVGNGEVYGADAIGTDMNRARVLSSEGKALLLESFRAAIPREFTATAADGQAYKPADLTPEDIINDRTRPDRQGYVAGPLDGVWARAPYLHNGSVPTLRHLLAPGNPESRRPKAFVRGLISYDQLNVGFDWDLRLSGGPTTAVSTTVVFDTGWDGATNRGHDLDITVDDEGRLDPSGRSRRLDWSGPEHRAEFEDLLEFLKTL